MVIMKGSVQGSTMLCGEQCAAHLCIHANAGGRDSDIPRVHLSHPAYGPCSSHAKHALLHERETTYYVPPQPVSQCTLL
jgi:hypothetical protein